MRKLYFLVPGMGGKFACGGLWAELKTFELAQQICPAEVVTYRKREKDVPFLSDLLQQQNLENAIFVMSWGFDVPKLAARLKSYNLVYHAHSAGYGFSLPADIPIITVSRNTMGYWGQHSPHSPIYYLPNQISDGFCNLNLEREIDVLVQLRKSSHYLIQELVPALKQHCKVQVVESYVEDLPGLFNRAKVYLYDSAEYWAQRGVSEGFGLQPMEALACGCQVFSSVNGGLSDYLDPGFKGHKIAGFSKEYDLKRILRVLQKPKESVPVEDWIAEYRAPQIIQRLQVILEELNDFFDGKSQYSSQIEKIARSRTVKLRLQRIFRKLSQKYLHRN
ncbi:glycosyltransferase [Lusitaniella coriacea LEGE 07157]|uniref:Glycosyltransferase n=1 Tax=Lusitaniella coriacea LEGE 07157 TaxID=945747 RepID=A0A8J7AXL4_9CYAN|nr:glycosyltransferase [Lusitaniella coriacea]MBE9114554.1 glycosyltransferase [Lusitaniella coriacea LEGE 07157]